MFNKFVSGLVVGLGFSIALVTVITAWVVLVIPHVVESGPMTVYQSSTTTSTDKNSFHIEKFGELPLDEMIANATVILRTEIRKNEQGRYQSVIKEILKQQDGVDFYYKVGDVYNDHSDYNNYEERRITIPNGFIVFMTGSPATMRYSVSYSENERISGLGDLPLVLLREKCADN